MNDDIDQGGDVSWQLEWLEQRIMYLHKQRLLSKNDTNHLIIMMEDVLKNIEKSFYFEKCMQRYHDYF
jgi:hypothetical protein